MIHLLDQLRTLAQEFNNLNMESSFRGRLAMVHDALLVLEREVRHAGGAQAAKEWEL